MGDKVSLVTEHSTKEPVGYLHHCPGCGYGHMFYTFKPNDYNGAKWVFDGNLEKPTFSPSMLVNAKNEGDYPRCHYFLRNGKIQYLNDSTHHLAGQTIDMEDV